MTFRFGIKSNTRKQIFNIGLVVVVCASLIVQYYPAASFYAEVATALCLLVAVITIISKLFEPEVVEELNTRHPITGLPVEMPGLLSDEYFGKVAATARHVILDINPVELRRRYLFNHAISTEAVLNFHKLVNQEARNAEAIARVSKIKLEASRSKFLSEKDGLPITVSWDDFIHAANLELDPSRASNQNLSPDPSLLLSLPGTPTVH